ncbi:hypothetical protein BJ875DRAFT_459237 [Amylocarpus encephaloides]|uniref:Filamentation protein n=1 Tax=Amylocarpus encephaloides TaxID=45428 RepID=A0A9P7YKD4_9HELO|nr:hypothetical protein BJ875DRAFT_459237 [Amylocarpus encephaloides]
MSREQTKSAYYIQQLDEARCHGNWDAVPELVRKVKKHAQNRTCLALTAESEHAIHEASLHQSRASRPGTADTAKPTASSSGDPVLPQYIPLLLEAIDTERSFVEDSFQAEVCLGWLHWSLGQTALAISGLPKSIEAEFSQLDGTNKESVGWTRVCALKASYIKGTAQVRTGSVAEALETYDSALPILSTASSGTQGKELWSWTELFLTGFCMLSSHALKSKITPILETETLSAFRAWDKFWETQNNVPQGGRALEAEVPRRRVWKEYYITLTDLLQRELPFPTTSLTTTYAETSTRLQQRAELKKIETRYETLLLNEVQFPKAEQASEEVEAFVEMVMENWRILCGSKWKEHDLGEGGSEAMSRGILDILYRAATKTFHSTAILRHLFTVHIAIAEFELALKAFDTYLEIVTKGKARVEKTGEAENELDDDEIVMRTVSECIRVLCRYGTRQGAEKAKELGQYLEKWLDVHYASHGPDGRPLENGHSTNLRATLSPPMLAMTWRSVGICHAQWARFTYDGPSRTEIQLKAIKSFKKALSPEYQCSTDVETLFALGTILAERRELGPAIEVVKMGLRPQRLSATNVPPGSGTPERFVSERRLIPLWHLMALLLSARQEFVTAARSCEGAFEQFQDPKFLFGEEDIGNSFRSDHLNEKVTPRSTGIVDDMDEFEKEGVLQVKMTQLALIEVLEGPEIAVNASDELLGLYARLFGDPQKDTTPTVSPRTTIPPKSAAGTVRSIRGSIFGRAGRSLRKGNPVGSTISEINEKVGLPRPQTTQTVASTISPTIQVTSETGSPRRSNSVKAPHHREKLQKRSDSASRKKTASQRNRSSSTGTSRLQNSVTTNGSSKPMGVYGESYYPPGDSQNQDSSGHEQGEIGLAVTPNSSKSPPPNSQQMSLQEASLKHAHSTPLSNQNNRLPNVLSHSSSTAPVTRFPREQQSRRRTTILIRVWLLISGFYRRALMFEDAKGAVDEAEKLVQFLQEDISRDLNGNVTLQSLGWGGGKSVCELWGDVFSERGLLAVAEPSPYVALDHFESALTNFADHCSATVGLSNLLLDIYTEKLRPPPAIPKLLRPPDRQSASTLTNLVGSMNLKSANQSPQSLAQSRLRPLGVVASAKIISPSHIPQTSASRSDASSDAPAAKELPTVTLDRLAARDRAYGLLSRLTKLGSGWNYSEAWFALARAYEEGGQFDKAREVLWWCVELEESRGVRDWTVVGSGGYVL